MQGVAGVGAGWHHIDFSSPIATFFIEVLKIKFIIHSWDVRACSPLFLICGVMLHGIG